MDSTVGVSALFWGALSAVSLPLGAIIGLVLTPKRRVASSAMAFGGGALLFALTIELFGHVLHVAADDHGHVERPGLVLAAMAAAVLGGVLFNTLNLILEGKGGFLRRRGLIRRHVVRQRRSEAHQLLQSLSKVDYFRSLPAEEVLRLIPDVETMTFDEGQIIFNEGDEGDGLYVVAEGVINVSRKSESGEDLIIASIGPGDVVGEMSLVTDNPRSATVLTESHVRAWKIPKEPFHRHMEESPNLKAAIHQVVADRIQSLEQAGHVTAETATEWAGSAVKHIEDQTVVGITSELVQEEQHKHGNPALAIWMGIALDSIPESLVIGMLVVTSAAEGTAFSIAFIAGVFLANMPEAMSSAVTMRKGGMTTTRIFWMWFSLCVLTAAGAWVGTVILPAHPTGSDLYLVFVIEGLAGGAMLTMIAQTMLPEAFEQGGGPIVGLSTLGGFLAALAVKMMP